MIIKAVQDNIFNTDAKHIAFAINTEGINDAGFAGNISRKYWNELAFCGYHDLGTVLSKTVDDKTYHALVCHSLANGWGVNQEELIKNCFDLIPSNGEEIATIAIGTGLIGIASGADFRKIICGMCDSNQKIILHSVYTIYAVRNCYNEEKGLILKKQK